MFAGEREIVQSLSFSIKYISFILKNFENRNVSWFFDFAICSQTQLHNITYSVENY